VGIFSFLSGKKDDAVEQSAPSAAPSSVASHTPAPDPHPADTPFTPPDAWNVDALTAPHPTMAGEVPQVGPLDREQTAALQGKVVEAIKTVFDPEIPVDIYELGLVYEIVVDAERRVLVRMTLTSPACPSAQQLPQEVRYKVKAIPEVTDAWVEIVWEPPWTKDRMSEAAKLTLGFF
jgi:FeS assembly SUF system protein